MGRTIIKTLLFFFFLSAANAAFNQTQFVISFWVDPVVDPSQFTTVYKDIADANFTTILGGFGAVTPETVIAQLQAAYAFNLSVIPSTCETAEGPGPNNTTCVNITSSTPPSTLIGYQMWDEPAESDFPTVSTWAKSVQERAPTALRFINLLPNYGFPQPNATEKYEQYVQAYVATVNPDILSFDHYPLFGPSATRGGGPSGGGDDDDANGNNDHHSDVSMAGYHRNLQVISAAAKQADIPFWNFFASMPFNGRPDVTEAQIRWQVYTSLAYGAKGVMYFCYYTPTGSSFVWANAIITPQVPVVFNSEETKKKAPPTTMMNKGPHWLHAQRINTKLRVYGQFLLENALATTVFLASGNGTQSVAVPPSAGAATVLSSVGGSGAGPSWSVLLGGFTMAQATTAVGTTTPLVVQNQDVDFPLLVTLTPLSTISSAQELDPQSGLLLPATDDAPELPGWQVYIEAGDARVFVL